MAQECRETLNARHRPDIMTVCLRCDDFGWVPEAEAENGNWYRSNWRVMLDPTIKWMRCPLCPRPEPTLPRVQECLAEVLLRKVINEIDEQRHSGDWSYGTWDQHPACHYLTKIALVTEQVGRVDQWLLISSSGVMRNLDQAACLYHLERAGVPPPVM